MALGKGSAPTPPNPRKTAAAQTGQNIATAVAQQAINQTNQVTPWGSLTYNQTGTTQFTDPNTGEVHDIPQYTATTDLSRPAERAVNAQGQAGVAMAELGRDSARRLGGVLGRPLNDNGLPELQAGFQGDWSRDRRRVERALGHRLEPGLERDTESLRTTLANQGIVEGSEAFDRAMNRMGEQRTDARMQTILAGGAEQSRLAGLDQARAGFTNQARSQGLDERTAMRGQSINEVAALLGGGQVQSPTFQSTPTAPVAGVDRAGLTMANYNAQLAQYQQRQQMFGNILGLGARVASGGAF